MEFHEELKAARIKTGLTQQQIADELGITKSTYCGYETAKRSPDPQRIKQLAKVLHVSADALLDISIEKETSPAPAKAEAEEVEKWLTDLLVERGYIRPGEDISDRDAEFLIHWIGLLDAWFEKE
nr:MAG TPA: helix-turn-helix domain protein [Caudoviricetes sp.]